MSTRTGCLELGLGFRSLPVDAVDVDWCKGKDEVWKLPCCCFHLNLKLPTYETSWNGTELLIWKTTISLSLFVRFVCFFHVCG